MNETAVTAFRAARTVHEQVVALQQRLEKFVAECVDKGELADVAYAMREASKLVDDTRKRLDGLGETAQKVACLVSVQLGDVSTIRTEHCSATPDVRQVASPPRRSTRPEEFARLMDHLGVPKHLWEGGDHAVVQPHWPGLMDYLARQAAEGKPLPPGIDPSRTFPEYKLVIRAKKGVTE